jgi:hypothetical protein
VCVCVCQGTGATTFRIMISNITTITKMTLGITVIMLSVTFLIVMLKTIMLSVTHISYCYAKCHCAECPYDEWHYAECHISYCYAECHVDVIILNVFRQGPSC